FVNPQDPEVVRLALDHYLDPAKSDPGPSRLHPDQGRQTARLRCAKNHPGEGDSPRPPIDFGMSVVRLAPSGPVTVTRRPSPRTAVAALSVYLASLRCSRR